MKQISAITNYGYSTIQNAIKRVTKAVIDSMEGIFLSLPDSEEDWMHIAADFETDTKLPNCLGAIGDVSDRCWVSKVFGTVERNGKILKRVKTGGRE